GDWKISDRICRLPSVVGPPLSKRRLGLADDGLECRRFADREIRQHLAIDRDPGFAKAGDETAVVEAEGADGGIEPLNPQRAEAALAPLAVAIGVLIGLLDGLLGNPNRVLAAAVIAFGRFENLFVLCIGGDPALDAGHGGVP